MRTNQRESGAQQQNDSKSRNNVGKLDVFGLFNLEKKAERRLDINLQIQSRYEREDGDELFSMSAEARSGNNDFKLEGRMLRLCSRKKFLTVRLVKGWNRFHRQ